MRCWCCPPGHGCNADGDSEPCALNVCRDAAPGHDDAAEAVVRWGVLQAACEHRCSNRERRFRRRAFERARDRALLALALARQPAGRQSTER